MCTMDTMKSILLVDDEPVVCAELRRRLRSFGFRVEAAHSAEAALRSIRRTPFDAVVLEFNLRSEANRHPRSANGLQVVLWMRAAQMRVPVVMYTVMEGMEYEAASLRAGADRFVHKAAGLESMVSLLRECVRKWGEDSPADPG